MSASARRDGVLVVEKPSGPTSHDVVAGLRRALGTSRVGHAGTLDPLASGVLVVLVGEATKLAAYLTAQDKGYVARIAFGRATTTLDAQGETTAEAAVSAELRAALAAAARGEPAPLLEAALAVELRRTLQVPPAHSAIQVGGRRSYERARAGEEPVLEPRDVTLLHARLAGANAAEATVELELRCTKGYYVRALARDLGERLGVPAHLAALRRTHSGPFVSSEAVPPAAEPSALVAALISVEDAARRALAIARLTEEGTIAAAQGKALCRLHFLAPPPDEPEAASAWLDARGRLVAIGARSEDDRYVVRRGFRRDESGESA